MLSITRRRAPVRTPLDAQAVVTRVLSLLELEAERRGVRLTLEAAGAGTVRADADQLQQVVLNLVRNALEASTRGTKVTVTLAGDAEHLTLTVADEGPGVPGEARAQLFEPFFTTKPDGSGLGLSVVRSLVREHQGEVKLLEVPRGCAFSVTLPRNLEGGAT
jgi:signal transduction histidine kinase